MTKFSPADHLFKYEVEETDPDDEDMVELHVVQADDVKREKGMWHFLFSSFFSLYNTRG
jgi:hypothetical protein